ncbi:unnamed protein product [Larinioides sclopetarius]|uniref:Cyclin-like domain-containing protein n=1 Tax=Larinioides sclopetarius TaxID=280406 RepID=A0AAV2BDP8_9ARAC
MELYCCESENVTRAYDDPVLNEDSRVFENLLVIEDRYVLAANYFKCTQSDLKPYMRTVVAEWMQEVCEEERCQDEVFPLAVNCLDRFLLLVRVDKSQLQLLGAVCLFLASKLRQSRPLTAERLCLYSDHSISVVQLISWELLVLNTLKWDLAAITPFDFVGHILKRLGIMKGEQLIRRHAHTFIGLCTTVLISRVTLDLNTLTVLKCPKSHASMILRTPLKYFAWSRSGNAPELPGGVWHLYHLPVAKVNTISICKYRASNRFALRNEKNCPTNRDYPTFQTRHSTTAESANRLRLNKVQHS